MQMRLKLVSVLYIFFQNEADFKHHEMHKNLAPMPIQTWQITSEIAQFLPCTKQQNELSAMAEKKKMVHDQLYFKASWRECCDHSYFRDLTSNQRRLRK